MQHVSHNGEPYVLINTQVYDLEEFLGLTDISVSIKSSILGAAGSGLSFGLILMLHFAHQRHVYPAQNIVIRLSKSLFAIISI